MNNRAVGSCWQEFAPPNSCFQQYDALTCTSYRMADHGAFAPMKATALLCGTAPVFASWKKI